MVNKISKKCPTCGFADADVLAIVHGGEIVYRCLANGRKHQFRVKISEEPQKQELIDKGYFPAESLND